MHRYFRRQGSQFTQTSRQMYLYGVSLDLSFNYYLKQELRTIAWYIARAYESRDKNKLI
jgi:hypothetical protein